MRSNKRLLARGKRVLAWLLAVTMVTGTLPTSVAHAAELPVVSSGDVATLPADDVAASDVVEGETPADDAAASDNITSDSIASDEKTADVTAVDPADGGADVKEVYEDAATPTPTDNKAVVTWDDDKLATQVKNAGFTYDYVAKQAEAAYKAKSDADYTALESGVDSAVKVKAGGKEVAVTPTYAWQQNGAAVTGKPAAVGKYQLVATVNAAEGIAASDATTVLVLEIKKAPVEFTVADWTFRAGITAGEVKEYFQDNLAYLVNGSSVAQGDIASAVTFAVKEYNAEAVAQGNTDGVALGDDAVLQMKKDYCVDVTVTLKEPASYEVVESRINLRLTEQTATEIVVTYADAASAKAKGKVFDGEPLVYAGEDGTFNSANAGFTYKLLYDKDGDDECETELVGANIAGMWVDADKNMLGGNPSHAGVYYYLLTYSDENETYEFAYKYIRVEIEPAKIMVVPQPLPVDFKVSDGRSVGDVLKNVTYKVFNVSETGGKGMEKTDIDKRFWGDYDSVVETPGTKSDTNQYYEPLFEIQKGTPGKDAQGKDTTEWKSLANWETIRWQEVVTKVVTDPTTGDPTTTTDTITYSYRIVFTGNKGVYDENGNVVTECGINVSQGDYTVSVSQTVREATDNVANIDRSTAVPVTINVDAICENGVGKTYDNPIERTYAGFQKGIYATRGEYKKATIAGTGAGVLKYTWYQLDVESIALDKDGKIKLDELIWDKHNDNDSWYNGVDDYCSPYRAGVYRLEVSYVDSTYATYAAPVYLYYVVHPQSAKAEVKGSPEIYIDGVHTAGDLLESLQNENPDDKATYVELKGYRVKATDKNTVTPVELAEGEVDPIQALMERYFNDTDRRLDYFCVERQRKTDEANSGTWEKVENYQTLLKDESYRISFNAERYNRDYTSYDSDYIKDEQTVYYTICTNTDYNFGWQLDKCNQVLDENYYENVSATVATKTSVAAPITIDTSAFKSVEKVYDGKPLDLAALQNSIKVTTMVDGKETDITSEVKPQLKYAFHNRTINQYGYDKDGEYVLRPYVDLVHTVHAGVYDVQIIFETNEKYLQTTKTVTGMYETKKKEVAVTFGLKGTDESPAINAGVYFDGSKGAKTDQIFADEILRSDNVDNACNFAIVGDPVVVEAVMDGETELRPAVSETDVAKLVGKPYSWWINESTDKNSGNYQGYLKSSKTYYVKVTRFEYGLREELDPVYRGRMSYSFDYEAVSEEKSFKPVRAAAAVAASGTALNDKVTTADSGVFQHEITAREDVPFNYGEYKDYNNEVQGRDSNIFRFRLYEPGEFYDEKTFTDNSYVYQNAIENIEKAGGYVQNRGTSSEGCSYITVAFPVPQAKTTAEFDIVFATNYVEKYVIDLGSMVLEADMNKAVAPKSLAFNGAPKKLAVGEEVQLDVTIKKNLMSDIILLGYESDNEQVLQVSDTGYVTAVAKGSANITVYPCKRVGGSLTRLDEGKKSVAKKLKITVTDVAKPKLSKVTGRDAEAFITYTIPANGYRRELYVKEGKCKEKDFEDAIAAVQNGDYSAFAYVNLDLSDKEKDPYYRDSKNVVSNVEIYGLKPEFKEGYTVYLRNVSGLYKMADGTEVATSAAGAVKNFKTTKSEAKALNVYFEHSDKFVRYNRDYSREDQDDYKVNFADKASKVSVEAKFWEMYSKDYSDNADYIWRTLPLGAEKGSYNVPKLKFFVSEVDNIYDDREDVIDTSVMTKVDDHKWIYKTPLAKIDNGGKVTYLGKGVVYVLAYDMVSKHYDWLALEIDANPDSVSAKAIKLQPGQSVWLSEQLEYKEKKVKVVNYQYDYYDLLTKTESNEYFKIEYVWDAHDVFDEQGGDYKITALKAGGSINIDVEDRVVKANGGSSTTLKITSPAIEPVKSAKVSAAYDDKFRVTFAYPKNNVDFRFELKNASGKVITDTIMECEGVWDKKSKKYIYTVNFGDPSEWHYWDEWQVVGNNDVSAVVGGSVARNRITLLSNYTVGITAVYGDRAQVNDMSKAEVEKTQMSKTVNVKVKTTNIPASYWDVNAYNIANDYPISRDGGEKILVYLSSNYSNVQYFSNDILLRAGNTYDIAMAMNNLSDSRQNVAASMRMTDSLTWKSTNAKVASIKTNPGTFTAKLVTGKQGTTTIEVTSKLTKKVIARWKVTVGAVGDASKYFGENTPYKSGDGVISVTGYADLYKNATKLTLNNPRSVALKPGQTMYFVFEVPAYGKYNIQGGKL